MSKSVTLSDIAQHIGAELVLSPKLKIHVVEKISPLHLATETELSFLANKKYINSLADTKACCVIVSKEHQAEVPCHALVMDNPYLGFAKAAQLFEKQIEYPQGVHDSAVVGENCIIPGSASVGPNAVLANNVQLGENVIIAANVSIADGVILGDNTHIYPNVSIYHDVVIGQDCIVHSGTVIGGDGFGMAQEQGRWLKVPQLGAVSIGDRVEIGCNTTIDRGALTNTEIHNDVKIDNQVHLAHNVIIGENTAIVTHVGVSGSTKIGKNCILAGKVGTVGHIEIADNVIATGRTNLTKSIKEPGVYSSTLPARPQKEWARTVAHLMNLDKLVSRVSKIEKRLLKED